MLKRDPDAVERNASADALGAELERVGLVEVRIEDGRARYRTTPHGERVRQVLASVDRADAEALLDTLLGATGVAPRRN
jgi:hypothetical protein